MIGGWGTPDEMTITQDVPFMAEKEYRYIQDLINNKEYKTALEWGAGSSTIWFPKNTTVQVWTSMEHNKKYINYLEDKVNTKVELLFAGNKDEYILVGPSFNNSYGKYDFILIDGLYRDECLERAFDLLNQGGTILLHDSGRKTYQNWYKKYPHTVIFEGEGWLGDGWDHRGLCAFTKN